ncbi:MAG: glycosyltransferase family 2 protein [Gammaproteobacteria bacterium]
MHLSVILVSYNTEALLIKCLSYLKASLEGLDYNIIIIDNASSDGSVNTIAEKFSECLLIKNTINNGFGRANNQALDYVQGKYVLLLNTDAFIEPDSLSKTVRYMDEHPKAGILGVKLVGRDSTLQPSCRHFPTPWNLFLERSGMNRFFPDAQMVDNMEWDHAAVRSCDWVPGCFYLVRREVIDQVGLFDPKYFLYYEEVDHCFAAKKAGWEVHYYPYTSVIHLGGESAKSEGAITESGRQLETLQTESELLYFRKNHGLHGLGMYILLATITDVINMLKAILKRNSRAYWSRYAQHSVLFWKLIFKTRAGICPTR